ncbi:hypothetical protein [Longispora albida]|uniref:hypothetical protein n=1 Tax=Longispora albida TaxID=203523 RepID=UPI00037BB08C|nr:hypothetical protein [Longispora albida]
MRVHLYDALPIWRMIRLDEMLYLSAFDSRWEGALHAAFSRTLQEMIELSEHIV